MITMKRIYNYILLAVMACATVSCNNEELTPENSSTVSGDEVQFGLSLGNPETKTVYGAETNNAFPIYWVNGDKVQIFSPQCLEGRRSAEYKVTVSGTEQKYADQLTKTGDAGVQWSNWGNNTDELYSFYSLYPSGNYTLSQNGDKAENIVINYSQNIVVNDGNVHSDMEDCLMYAKTEGVTKGATVNLTYDPISTVIYVTLRVAKGTGTSSTKNEYTIQSISLVADQDIAGTFSLDIKDGSFAGFAEGKASTTIMAQISNPATNGFHTITNDQSLSIPLFLAPIPDLNVKNWKIQVVANNTTYTKTLNLDKTLNPGMIHKITLPELSATSSEWATGNWMENIPRNVYLSEVSLPGSWNALNYQFQGLDPSIAAQYDKGVRAFHLDTRWKAQYSLGGYGLFEKVLGLGVLDGNRGGSSWSGTITDGDKYAKTGHLFEDVLKEIVGYIKINTEEYIVLLCSFAQESINYQSTNGYWYEEINAICSKDDYASYILDAKTISENTLVGDAIGKILVIVNMTSTITKDTKLPENSKCLFTYLPSELTADHFNGIDDNQDKLWKSVTTTAEGGSKITTTLESGINMYNNQSQITSNAESGITTDNRGYAPTLTERTAVLNKILSWSKENYSKEDYGHDMWLYLGLGGYQISDNKPTEVSNSHKNIIAATYNKWINGKILEMGTPETAQSKAIPYYPVGIVLMNYTTDNSLNLNTPADPVYSTDVVKNILLLNNKYRLQYDPNKPSDYNPNATPQSAAASYSSGMKDSDVAAFGWD